MVGLTTARDLSFGSIMNLLLFSVLVVSPAYGAMV
jgi:hypothetical protein